jgi:hypothetical protein
MDEHKGYSVPFFMLENEPSGRSIIFRRVKTEKEKWVKL